ncbi:DUF4190 domain-containing protein [Paenibacillus sp. 19GGS1-52]|uniref:DUF4190 domain-containing protein n=1 Tax=Paenibacillus sp. 19GGS1-52 TaxID=2758563 RepID=UPI001EFA8BE8|nr:DUF4190 domain-containing protein [Paenibacillus sp. 19GGS1-52]ULO04683.1 DUF4190 domain-containing protein [Paenibacillus sp. 19GGS1-52]
MSYQPYGNQEYYPPQPPPARTNGKSIAALVLGILSIVLPYIGLLFGIIAIIFSAISLKEIRMRNEQGRGMAIAGLVCGIVGTILYAVIIVLIILAIVFLNGDNVNGFSNFNNI